MDKLAHIPTNIITGALGVGKTTLIQALLKDKPQRERWAVLVNEFGEVGIDGAILAGSSSKDTQQDIFIKEVPGGCMCCTSGLPMQIALNLLLAQAKPDRLLIEPTGLGHPKEVLQTLKQEHYKDILNVQATLTLLDARKLANTRWRQHPTFQEQMQIADVLVITKSDLYDRDYTDETTQYMDELCISSTPIAVAEKGKIDGQLLARPSRYQLGESTTNTHHHNNTSDVATTVIAPDVGVQRFVNSGQGYYSRGWLCARDTVFDYLKCQQLFNDLTVARLKAVVITDKGIFSFNIEDSTVTESRLETAVDTRIELIVNSEALANQLADTLENQLRFT